MDYVGALTDLAKALFSLALFTYALRLFRIFRGGIMHRAFVFLSIAPLFFAITEILHTLRFVEVTFAGQKPVSDAFEFLFIVALFVGFYLLSAAWRVKK